MFEHDPTFLQYRTMVWRQPRVLPCAKARPGKKVAAIAQGPCRLLQGGRSSAPTAALLHICHRHKDLGSSSRGQLGITPSSHGPASGRNSAQCREKFQGTEWAGPGLPWLSSLAVIMAHDDQGSAESEAVLSCTVI